MKPWYSLRYRIAGTIFVLEAAMMALVLWQTLSLSLEGARNQQLAHEEATLNTAGEVSRNALISEEYDDLLPYIGTVPQVDGVTHVVVADYNHTVIASTDLSELGKPIRSLDDGTSEFWRTREIANDNEVLGLLAIKFSNAKLIRATEEARTLGISIALIGMGIIAVVGLVMGYLLTRRLSVLTKSAHRFAQGDLSAKTGLKGYDELAEVGQAFDQMAGSIQRHVTDLEEDSKRFALAVSGSNDGIWDWDLRTGETYFSPRWKEMLGLDDQNPVLGNAIGNWQDRIHPEDREHTLLLLDEYLAGKGDNFSSEHRLRSASGDYIWVLIRGKALRDKEGNAVRMNGSLIDITDRKRQEFTIQHQALHDALTNLPNRIVLHDRLQQAILMAERENRSLAVLMMDLDRFKEINDTLGHNIGDAVIQKVAARLEKTLRKSDTVSRFGGDEFTVVLPGVNAHQAVLTVHRIFKALEPSYLIDEHNLHVEASVGIALYPDHGQDPTSLIKFADVAMYSAKRSNSGYVIYDSTEDENSPTRLTLMNELGCAIENDELVLHYQPKIDVKTHDIVGVEALVRWQHPEHGLLFPDAFLPPAERGGLIKPLTLWVLKEAIKQHRQWHDMGIELPIAINISVRSLQDLDFPAQVAKSLSALDVAARCLEMEITESAIMADPDRALKVLSELDDMGVLLSLDDFGTGYSSLAYLRRLPVQEIKIDRSFVIDISRNKNNIVILRSTVDLGHNLGMKVIAEGVEDQETLELLESIGCDRAQGYYITKAIPAGEFITWLRTSSFGSQNQFRKAAKGTG